MESIVNHLCSFKNSAKTSILNNKYTEYIRTGRFSNLAPLKTDTVNLKIMFPTKYKDIFQFFAAKVLEDKNLPKQKLSSIQIARTLQEQFKSNKIYSESSKKSKVSMILLSSYIPKDIIENEVRMVNEARKLRLSEWKSFMESPNEDGLYELIKQIKSQNGHSIDINAVKLVLWNAINSELSENDRHIPAPINRDALYTTINHFVNQDRENFDEISGADIKKQFIGFYSNTIIEQTLKEKGISTEAVETWVKIPSIRHDRRNFAKNVRDVESLSNRNWCTRSKDDKARAALEDGDFHIFLQKDSETGFWIPKIAMTCYAGKISQIQGENNDNTIPLDLLNTIKQYIIDSGLVCSYNITDEFPESGMQILIAEKLSENSPEIGKTFYQSIQENDASSIFKYLKQKKLQEFDDGTFIIGTYKPSYVFDNKGHNVPYSMLGINEDELLKNVIRIEGDFYLSKQNRPLFDSKITEFPEKLKKVTGRIYCNNVQFKKFRKNIAEVSSPQYALC